MTRLAPIRQLKAEAETRWVGWVVAGRLRSPSLSAQEKQALGL